jgi:hypothetical protein
MKYSLSREIAYLLPKEIIRWAFIRLATHAACTKYSNIEMSRLTVVDALEAWK